MTKEDNNFLNGWILATECIQLFKLFDTRENITLNYMRDVQVWPNRYLNKHFTSGVLAACNAALGLR